MAGEVLGEVPEILTELVRLDFQFYVHKIIYQALEDRIHDDQILCRVTSDLSLQFLAQLGSGGLARIAAERMGEREQEAGVLDAFESAVESMAADAAAQYGVV